MHWCPVALGIVFLLSLAYLQRDRALRGQNDFVQLYAGAKLAGTPDLYSRDANLALIKSIQGFTMETVVYTRPPFYAAFLRPLALLPYRVGYAVFSLVTLGSILWFVIRFSKECPSLPFFAAISIPLLTALCNGQDTPLLLAILGGSILLTRRKMEFLAGLVLSLCAIKFHLFLFIPLLLLVKRRWRILGGAASGTALLAGLGVLVNGVDSSWRYVAVLRDPWINPSAIGMPNLHGLVAVLHGDARLEMLFAGGVLLAFLWIARRAENYELLLAASLVCGLLVSFHSGVADDVVLFPAFVMVAGVTASEALRASAALILTPIPYFMALAGAPYSAFLPIALLLLLGMFCIAARDGRDWGYLPAGTRGSAGDAGSDAGAEVGAGVEAGAGITRT
jgi:Glycosyltransferase family 87